MYAATFMAEDAGFRQMLRSKAESGIRIRILLGDPDSPAVAGRGQDEGIDEAIAGKVRNAIILFRPLQKIESVEIRLHGTTLYNSIYRADDQLLVNTHIYGMMASNAPAFHLRKIPGGDMVSTYLESFERVWESARPYEGA